MRFPTESEWTAALAGRHGEALQRRFAGSCAAVCGLGGLGSHIAPVLARAGVGKLILIDFDRVELTNLHRQQYRADQIGQYKTEAMAALLREIAPYQTVLTHTVRITEENFAPLLREADVICEAFDDAEAKAMLADGVLSTWADKYLVAASGMAGIGSANTIRTQRVSSRFYLCGDGVSDVRDSGGLFCSRVMLCAAHQAHTVLRILTGQLSE